MYIYFQLLYAPDEMAPGGVMQRFSSGKLEWHSLCAAPSIDLDIGQTVVVFCGEDFRVSVEWQRCVGLVRSLQVKAVAVFQYFFSTLLKSLV